MFDVTVASGPGRGNPRLSGVSLIVGFKLVGYHMSQRARRHLDLCHADSPTIDSIRLQLDRIRSITRVIRLSIIKS